MTRKIPLKRVNQSRLQFAKNIWIDKVLERSCKEMVQRQTANLFRKVASLVGPPPKWTVSEWADESRILSKEASAEHGRWNTDRAPYQREIMNAVNDPTVEDVVIMSSAQIGKTEILNNIIGYFIDYDPSPILLVMPTLEMAESYSKDRLASMIRDTPALTRKVSDAKSRDGNNTLLHKKFAGGHISLVGANSPASLASRPIRIVLADEVDRFPASAGTEGDPLSLAHKRTKTFWNRKKISVSTPTIKGISRIEAEYEESTKEQWCVSCPSCGVFQPYEWTQIRFEPVGMECRSCQEHHSEIEWKARPAKWIAQVPNAVKRGFHLNALTSPWESWDKIIYEFKEAKRKGTETLKTWKNTTLGEPWEENSNEHDHAKLVARRKIYGCDIPDGVLVLTAGVDVQNDRLEVEVVGWGVDEISWGISYKVFYGDPGQQAVWNQLDAFLETMWLCNDGSKLSISATCVDTGGHYTSEVYDFCKEREHRRIFAIKGKGGVGVPYVGKPSKVGRQNVHLFSLGVNEGKDLIYSRLRNEFEDKPGYCHFPIEKEKGYDEAFFIGLTSEYKKIRWLNGIPRHEWVKKTSSVRNEPLDLRNYATAALRILNPDLNYLKEHKLDGNVFSQTARRKKKDGVSFRGGYKKWLSLLRRRKNV